MTDKQETFDFDRPLLFPKEMLEAFFLKPIDKDVPQQEFDADFEPVVSQDPLNSQVGGAHYNNYAIQPIEYAMANDLDYCQANAIKYITRFRDKNGLEDLKKAIHNLQILIKLEYGENIN